MGAELGLMELLIADVCAANSRKKSTRAIGHPTLDLRLGVLGLRALESNSRRSLLL